MQASHDHLADHGLTQVERASGPQWTPPRSAWTLGTEGIGWVLYVPEGTNTNAQVRSDAQAAPDLKHTDGECNWTWLGVVSDSGLRHDITVTMSIKPVDGSLAVELSLDNDSEATVDSALFPAVRGVTVPRDRVLRAMTRDYYGAQEHPIWPTFHWNKGYYGTLRPTLMPESLVFGNPTAPFALMVDGHEALAASVAGPTAEITGWMWELEPGYSDTVGDHVPDSEKSPLRFSAVHLLDLAPGQSRQLASITLSHAHGGWQQALTPYRKARAEVANSQALPGWAAQPHSWYQVALNSPVGEKRHRFADLPDLARECAESGVAVLHVIGWNAGGQDRNNPSHDPDPDLGGPEALADAIAACHEIGVKVVLFTKFTWADQATPRFRDELIESAVRDPYGDYYRNSGYQYLTPHQLLDVNTRRLIPMCYLHEAYLRACELEFDKVVATGADGMLFDETMHHTPALLCYADNHGHRRGASVYSGDLNLARRLRARLPEDRQDFLFAGETLYEDLQSAYQLSYIRSHYLDHRPLTRYVNPALRMMTTVSGFDDRNQINQGILYGYLYCYEPRHFKGRLTDFPKTVAYGNLADTVRRELSEYLWDGTYLGDAPLHPSEPVAHATGTWVTRNGESLHLLANYDLSAWAEVPLPPSARETRLLDGSWQPRQDLVRVPPRSLLLVR